MSSFPGTPRLLKGAIIARDVSNPIPTVILFQYNPVTLTRTLEPQTTGGEGGNRAEAFRIKGAPIETIKLDAEIDAADQLEKAEANTIQFGISPLISALEMLVYPKSPLVIRNTVLLSAGTMEIIPPQAPFTLFMWGAQRVLPVRLTDLSITEEAYDTNLNPILAKVNLGMRVLSYNDFSITHPGYYIFLAHQVVKETLSVIGTTNNLAAVAGI